LQEKEIIPFLMSFRTGKKSNLSLDKNQSGLRRFELRSCKSLTDEQSELKKDCFNQVLLIQHRGHKIFYK